MSEFNNRIAAQRHILKAVNDKGWKGEELCGLSTKAIDRWVSLNGIDNDGRLVGLVRTAGEKLFFLANKSQEQVTEDYKLTAVDLSRITSEIEEELRG